MTEKEERKSRATLTLFFSVIVFVTLLAVIIFTAIVAYILHRFGLFENLTISSISGSGSVLILLGISLLLGAIIAYLASRFASRPFHRVIHAMNELASGNYKTRLEPDERLGRNPTVRELTDSFNSMAAELEQTEILQSDFINNFSHEFKTPIVSIAGFAKLLRRGCLSEKEKEEYTAIIEEESLRLSAMATNVLNLTKVENQSILTDVRPYNLSEQVRDSVLLLEKKWTDKEIQLELDFPEYEIRANEEMMREVWINLLDNAIKFAGQGGTVSVSISQDPQKTRVAVRNTGSRVLPEDKDRIFRKFYQEDRSHASEGNGIGLAVVRKIVELHKGQVQVDSRQVSGLYWETTFTVEIPQL